MKKSWTVWIWLVLSVLLLAVQSRLAGQTVTVDTTGITATQAIIHVVATNGDGSPFGGSCAYRVSEGTSFSALVNDVNPSLFPGANTDARPGSMVRGGERFFVAGTRTAAQASDNRFYSRALQADTTHWVGATCGSVPEQSTTFKTVNPPMGNSYPEFPRFDAAAFGNHATPSIDYTDKTKTYIDPLSGILLKRITGPLDYTNNTSTAPFNYVRDLNGAWSNAAGALSQQNPANLASTSTPNAPLFLAWNSIDSSNSFDAHGTVNDLQLLSYCSGSGSATLQACVSLDSGQTCASGTIELACPVSPGLVSAPSNYPAPMFAGWSVPTQTLSKTMLSNSPSATVSVSGNIVTWVSGYAQFYAERATGSKMLIPASACPGNICTVQSVDSATQITLQENAGTLSNVAVQDYGAGIRVWLKNTGGSVSASFTFNHHYSEQYLGATNAEFDTCSTKMITDIGTDKAGNALPTPLSGYLCSFSGQNLVLWIPSTGESRLLSTYWQQGVGRMQVPTNPFSVDDAKTFYATNVGNKHLYRATLTNPAGVYLEYTPGLTQPPAADQIVWTDVTAASTRMDDQLAAYAGPGGARAAAATGIFGTLQFVGVIGGYTVYDAATGGDTPCLKVRASPDTNQLVQAFDSFSTFPLRWGGCHSSPIGNGSLLNLTVNPIQRFDNTVPLGGPFSLRALQMKRGGVWKSFTLPITAATNSTNVTLTSPAHGLDPYLNHNQGLGTGKGPLVNISGGTGNWAALNGDWTATVPFSDPDHFTLPVDTSAFGPLTGSLVLTAAPPLIHSSVRSIAATNPAIVVSSVFLSTEPANHRFQDGDAIGFGNLPNTAQYYAKTSGYTGTTFAVYADQALTQPVSGATLQAAVGGTVYYAETCPAGLPASVTTGITFDSIGAAGVRCITLRVQGEPCSVFAAAGEQAKYPCKSDPTNTTKSSLQDMQVGDAIRDLARGNYDETMVLVRKIKNSETDIEATFMRWYGNKIDNGDNHTFNQSSNSHDVGWTPFLVPSNSHSSATGWMDATDPTNTFISADPSFGQAHGDFGYGNAPGLVTYAGGSVDHIVNKTIRDLLNTPLTRNKNEAPSWANSAASQLTYNVVQSYPGHRQAYAPPSEHVWKGDWGALNPAFGSGQTTGAGLFGGVNLTPVNGTTRVFKIINTDPSWGGFDRKRTPTYAWAGKYLYQDKSGPNSVLTDADLWSYCVADNAGECIAGSSKNDVFLVGKGFTNTGGYCLTNTLNVTAPCFIGANPLGGWALQTAIDPIDTTGRRIRRLTQGLTAPGMHWTFTTWLQSPDGRWGFFSTPYADGLRNEYYAMKLPPWSESKQVAGSINRNTFVPVLRKVQATAGVSYARARFGYAEAGPVGSYYCTSRRDSCTTEIPTATPTDPYAYASEPVNRLACSTGCTIAIPAIPGRVVYFVIERLDSAGNVVTTDPPEAIAIP